jgi:PAS domain S-box-containing protein
MDFQEGITLASQLIAGVVVIWGALKATGTFIARPIKEHFQKIHKVVDKIDKIEKEFLTNGGGSLKDHISRISVGLSEVQQGLRAQMAYETNPVFESDRDGNCIYANRAYLRMLGVGMEEIEGHGWKSFISPDSKHIVFEEWETAVKQHRDFKLTYKFVHADGHEICASCEAFAIKNDKKELLKYIGTITAYENMVKCDEGSI